MSVSTLCPITCLHTVNHIHRVEKQVSILIKGQVALNAS